MAQLGVDRPTGAPRRGPAPAHACVSEDDVATIAVAALRARWTIGERLPIGGPEVLSWDEVVDQCGRVLGRPIDVRWLTQAEAEALAPTRLAMLSLPGRTSPHHMREAADRLGIRLSTPADFLARERP
jgi:uncharacterized protein YbjT (DUF2867 family)